MNVTDIIHRLHVLRHEIQISDAGIHAATHGPEDDGETLDDLDIRNGLEGIDDALHYFGKLHARLARHIFKTPDEGGEQCAICGENFRSSTHLRVGEKLAP